MKRRREAEEESKEESEEGEMEEKETGVVLWSYIICSGG